MLKILYQYSYRYRYIRIYRALNPILSSLITLYFRNAEYFIISVIVLFIASELRLLNELQKAIANPTLLAEHSAGMSSSYRKRYAKRSRLDITSCHSLTLYFPAPKVMQLLNTISASNAPEETRSVKPGVCSVVRKSFSMIACFSIAAFF